jgi:hypothetical protein
MENLVIGVVPAQAGTHNPLALVTYKATSPWLMEPDRCGVWVPACAGTTILMSQIRPQNKLAVRPKNART